MTNASTTAEKRQPDSRGSRLAGVAALLAARPLFGAFLLIGVAVAVRAQGTVDADVAWQLWVGRQLNHGAHLYRDILEVNPPLWFWMAMPVDRLAALLHIRSDHLLIVLLGLAAALSIGATDRLIDDLSSARRGLLLAFASLILIAMPWLEMGQREHIALIGTMPYAALIAARRSGRPVPAGLAIAVGAGAALGFALKHYFLVVPLLLELWLLAAQRRRWRPVRGETIAVAAVGAAYALAMLVVARDYFTVMLPMLLLAYGRTGAKHWIDLFQPAVLTALASIVLLVLNRRFVRSAASGLAAALSVAAMAFTIVYFVQAKGWSYHAVPMLGCASIALAACLAGGVGPPRMMLLTAPALLLAPFAIALQQAQRGPESAPDVMQALRGIRSGETVGFISADPSFGWPTVLERRLRFPLRYYGFWMMQAVVSNEVGGRRDPRLTELGRRVVRDTVANFECTPPRRIIVARPTPAEARRGEFDILAFFLREPQFRRLMVHYRPIGRTSVQSFELQSDLEPPASCPAWSPV